MERVKGFEPSTSTLARLRSTPELHPRGGSFEVINPAKREGCFRRSRVKLQGGGIYRERRKS